MEEILIDESSSLDVALRSFWELESLGINDVQVYEEPLPFLDSVTFVQDRYEIGLPWIRSKSDGVDHFNLCYNHLKYLRRCLIKQLAFCENINTLYLSSYAVVLLNLIITTTSLLTASYIIWHIIL